MAYSVDLDQISRPSPVPYRRQCEKHGTFLFNAPFSPVKFWWFAEVDETLAQWGVTAVRMDDLWTGAEEGAQWSAAAVAEAARQAAAVSDEQVRSLQDYSMRESVETVLDWIRSAAARGHGVVGFYH